MLPNPNYHTCRKSFRLPLPLPPPPKRAGVAAAQLALDSGCPTHQLKMSAWTTLLCQEIVSKGFCSEQEHFKNQNVCLAHEFRIKPSSAIVIDCIIIPADHRLSCCSMKSSRTESTRVGKGHWAAGSRACAVSKKGRMSSTDPIARVVQSQNDGILVRIWYFWKRVSDNILICNHIIEYS